MTNVRHGRKRLRRDSLKLVQSGNREWWERTPMDYDWHGEARFAEGTREWFDEQDRRSAAVHRHFATDRIPFDRLIPFDALAGKHVLEMGMGSGFHAELMARAGARVTGIDLTTAAVERTKRRFALRGLEGDFQQWDAEQPRGDFVGRFDFVWSWGVIHHSARTARIVRNVEQWVAESGVFAGMVYHRDSTSAAATILRSWLRGRVFTQSIDEALWRGSDGFHARFYPADQWRDLLLGFFADASVEITGNEPDAVPLPRALRVVVAPLVPSRIRDRIIARAGSFILFEARNPLRAVPEDGDAESAGRS